MVGTFGGFLLSNLRLVPITFRHVIDFCKNIRPEDIAECLITSGDNPLDMTINEYVQAGAMCLINEKGEVLAIGGVHEEQMWLLGTTLIEKHKTAFLRYTKELILGDLMKVNERMYNITWKTNHLHSKWLKWLGCQVVEENEDFMLFLFERKDGGLNV